MLIVFGGLPRVGKTSLSRAVASRLRATWLRVDALEAAIWRAGLPQDDTVGLAAYVVAHAAATAQLALGGTVVIDAVNLPAAGGLPAGRSHHRSRTTGDRPTSPGSHLACVMSTSSTANHMADEFKPRALLTTLRWLRW